jgi:hypothetical protein
MTGKRVSFAASTDLKAQCEAFRQHLEVAISAELIRKLKGNGLSEVTIHQPEVAQHYGEIRNRIVGGSLTRLTSDDISFIADKIITKDPSAEFYDAHPALSVAIQKYHIVKALLEKVSDPQQFRTHYVRQLRELLKEREKDPESLEFVTRVGKAVGVHVPASVFFASQDSVNDNVLRPQPKTRFNPG